MPNRMFTCLFQARRITTTHEQEDVPLLEADITNIVGSDDEPLLGGDHAQFTHCN